MNNGLPIVEIILLLLLSGSRLPAQQGGSSLWVPDMGNGFYRNPVIWADYSDPDVLRAGESFYLVASSFSNFPGLPILRSYDLVNWQLVGHAAVHYPDSALMKPAHGNAIWAPSIRFHDGIYYIFFGDPDRGVYMTTAKNPEGPWQELKLVRKVSGWIDCCPFWDDDGNAYLVHAFANSRCGIKSLLAVNRMSPDGSRILDDGILVFNGQKDHPTIEGPKMYKRNGYYYIFAPAGGVKTGWQTVLRSRNIFGPYEDRIVLQQGTTAVNGPHQGAWISDSGGNDWFIHFQDRLAYGRVVHLQPMTWINDWPVIGSDPDGDGVGEPVAVHKKPLASVSSGIFTPETGDEFNEEHLGLQWQWESDFRTDWYSLSEREDFLRLHSQAPVGGVLNLWDQGNLLLQKISAESMLVTVKMETEFRADGERAGLIVFGTDYAAVVLKQEGNERYMQQVVCMQADRGTAEQIRFSARTGPGPVWLRALILPSAGRGEPPALSCIFSFSTDGKSFRVVGDPFIVKEGKWVGARTGVFISAEGKEKSSGFADFDYFRVTVPSDK